ncbi:MAG: SPOR domain-containing protein [Alphaproteobacteria bacterium]
MSLGSLSATEKPVMPKRVEDIGEGRIKQMIVDQTAIKQEMAARAKQARLTSELAGGKARTKTLAIKKPGVETRPSVLDAPTAITKPTVMAETAAVTKRVVMPEPVAVTKPTVKAEPTAVTKPIVMAEPAAVTIPPALSKPAAATKPRAQTDDGDESSREALARQVLVMNKRIDALTDHIEHLSKRIYRLAKHIGDNQAKIAEVKLNEPNARKKHRQVAKNSDDAMNTPAIETKPFWGVQLGAYRTRPGAEEAWGKIRAKPTAVELTEARVRCVPSRPLKNGDKLTLIVINEYASHKAANGACDALKTNGLACVAYYVR